jgi:hypothetical protein
MNMDRPQFQPYAYFSMHSSEGSALPNGCSLVVHHLDGRIMLVDWACRIFLAECALTAKELPLILALLNAWPLYCPYAHLLSLLSDESEQSIAKRLDPLYAESFQQDIAPVREELKECRHRLALLGLSIRAVYECGYLLCPLAESSSQQGGKLISLAYYSKRKTMKTSFTR